MPICPGCQQDRPMKAKGLCNSCYVYQKRYGKLDRERQPRGMCTVPGCDKKAHGRGLCDMHIRRMRVSGSFEDPRADNVNLKTNQHVYAQWAEYQRKEAYPIVPEWKDDFFIFMAGVGERPSLKHRLYRIDKSKPMGPGNFEWRERLVTRDPEETDAEYVKRHQHARRVETGVGSWNSDLMRNYGITLHELKAMAEAQNHLCAICGQPEKALKNGVVKHLAVDHDHKPGGKVRGLLCQACNQGLGNFKDNPDTLKKAIAYLVKHGIKLTA